MSKPPTPRQNALRVVFFLAPLLVPVLAGGPAGAAQQEWTPDSPTVAAVQGDRAGGRDAASEFRTGCEFDCVPPSSGAACGCHTAFLHVPSGWVSVQLHLDLETPDFSRFFEHKSFLNERGLPGLEASEANGIEGQRILFYAGHGDLETFSAIRKQDVLLKSFSVGDGNVRYFFALSCNLFAHGPRAPDGVGDFTRPDLFRPQDFNPDKSVGSSDYVADVFRSWGMNYADASGFRSPLNPRLRLACGGSTGIGGTGTGGTLYPMHAFWHYFSEAHLTPADSFLVGLYDPEGPTVPLCISRGHDYARSGLADSRFKGEPLAESWAQMPSSILIEYPVKVDAATSLQAAFARQAPAADPSIREATAADMPQLPVLLLGPASAPALLQHAPVEGPAQGLGQGMPKSRPPHFGPASPPPAAAFSASDVCSRPRGGGGSIAWRPVLREGGAGLSPSEWAQQLDAAGARLVERLVSGLPGGANEDTGMRAGAPIILQMHIDRAPAEQNNLDEVKAQHIETEPGCLYIRRPAVFRQGNLEVPIVGQDLELVKRCPASALGREAFSLEAGSAADPCQRSSSPLVSVVYSARTYLGKGADLPLRSMDEARGEALEKLERMEPDGEFEELTVRVAYRAAPAHCQQTEMYPVYRFEFRPKRGQRLSRFPSHTIEVPAHDLGGKRIEDTFNCPEQTPGGEN
jgi:hypothetical protein